MKITVSILFICLIATTALANITNSNTLHRIYGKWEWTYSKNNCTELYDFRLNNTSVVKSGKEISKSRFSISEKPDVHGFYRMTDVVTEDNGRTGCDGVPGGTPVGDSVTVYIFFHPTKGEMVVCQEPSFNACMGPLRRVSQ